MTAWSESELATLAEVAETFVRGDSLRRARLMADALDAAADPAQLSQFRLVLRVLESSAANLVLGRRAASFRAMSPADRERYLRSWADSPIPMRRSAFHALRKLATFLAYADPGVDHPNPRLAAIGYEQDPRPIAAAITGVQPTVPPLAPRSTADEPAVMEADAVIVGAGAGGGVVGAALARAGKSVVVLEAGPFVDETSMPGDELDAYDRLYLNHGLLTTWDGSVTMLAGTGVGGGTLINWMTSLPAPDWIREEWQRDHGIEGLSGTEWDDDMATIETELSVTEATVIPPKDAAILRGAEALGWEAATTRRNAAACGTCGSCPFGCRQGTRQSGLRVHLEQAHAAGARIVPDAKVRRVIVEGGRAVGVEADVSVDSSEPRRRLVVRAPVVVVAAGGLRTPAILQASGIDHPATGRHLRIHPVPIVAGLYREPIDMWRGTMQAARCVEFAPPRSGSNGYVIESAPGHPGLLALALPWEGADEHADLMLRSRRIAPFIAVTRDGGAGRVSVTRAGNVRIDYRLDADGVRTLRHALVSMARLARASGALEIVAVGARPSWHGRGGHAAGEEETAFARFETALEAFDFSPNRGSVFSAHQMGTARMGADPRGHPCDPSGRVRRDDRSDAAVGGLYVADSSLFPTGLGVNPMITVMALARRVGRAILADASGAPA